MPPNLTKLNNEIKAGLQKELAFQTGDQLDEKIFTRLEQTKQWFSQYDEDGSGDLDIIELNHVMEKLKITKTALQLKRMVEIVDEDFNGVLDYKEFVRMVLIEDGIVNAGAMKEKLEALDSMPTDFAKAEADKLKAGSEAKKTGMALGARGGFARPSPEQLATMRRNKEVREKEEKEKIEAGVDKNANMKLCFSTDSTQTPAQRELLGSTSLTPELLKALSDRLHKACSGDELDKETFSIAYVEILNLEDGADYADKVFSVFDQDGSGTISINELSTFLNMHSDAPIRDKLFWNFKVFDVDNSGSIQKEEMREMLISLKGLEDPEVLKKLGYSSASDILSAKKGMAEMETHLDNLFAAADVDKSGEISAVEFTEAAVHSPTLMRYLELII